eukprot:scaffold280983_cov71-Attheya_sp.AAC.4
MLMSLYGEPRTGTSSVATGCQPPWRGNTKTVSKGQNLGTELGEAVTFLSSPGGEKALLPEPDRVEKTMSDGASGGNGPDPEDVMSDRSTGGDEPEEFNDDEDPDDVAEDFDMNSMGADGRHYVFPPESHLLSCRRFQHMILSIIHSYSKHHIISWHTIKKSIFLGDGMYQGQPARQELAVDYADLDLMGE